MDSCDLYQWLGRVVPWLQQGHIKTSCVIYSSFLITIAHSKLRHNAFYLLTDLETVDLEWNQLNELMNLLLLDMAVYDKVRGDWRY